MNPPYTQQTLTGVPCHPSETKHQSPVLPDVNTVKTVENARE